MEIELELLFDVLGSTPDRVEAIISGFDENTLVYRPTEDHFSIKDIVGHFIHGEDVDWIPRLQLMLDAAEASDSIPTFESFDRFGMEKLVEEHSTEELVTMFQQKRRDNLDILEGIEITSDILEVKGIHPSLGEVNVKWLLNCWVGHDLSHLNQMNRILVDQFRSVGPWKEYLRILNE